MALKMLIYFAMTSWFGWIFLFVGISAIRERRAREIREHTLTTGSIVDYVRKETKTKRGVGVSWKPVIEFAANGRKYRLEYENNMLPDGHPVGEAVAILYDLSEPSHFHLESDAAFYKGGGNLVKLGVIWIVACAALTIIFAVFVGGLRLNFREIWYSIWR